MCIMINIYNALRILPVQKIGNIRLSSQNCYLTGVSDKNYSKAEFPFCCGYLESEPTVVGYCQDTTATTAPRSIQMPHIFEYIACE